MDETLTMKWGINSQGIFKIYLENFKTFVSEPTLTLEYIVSVYLWWDSKLNWEKFRTCQAVKVGHNSLSIQQSSEHFLGIAETTDDSSMWLA
jgi:hypothetical protein